MYDAKCLVEFGLSKLLKNRFDLKQEKVSFIPTDPSPLNSDSTRGGVEYLLKTENAGLRPHAPEPTRMVINSLLLIHRSQPAFKDRAHCRFPQYRSTPKHI